MTEEIGVAYLSVKPKMDGNFDSEVKKQGKVSGSGFGSAFAVAAGNLIANAVTNIASKFGEAIGSAVGAYANWEQLEGGVKKIFDQANIKGIFEDAQNAYKDLNLSANEYLESINQVGAAFAQTMGDQKGYDTARMGMKAISDYASGTGRSLDELNEKYAMITRATSSYQSIADQFSGILPATSADFLAQAQAAGFLSGEYTKLTDVPVAEYQEAVSKMLEKGVKDMGLAGNTAAESTKTISGSLAMLKGSWQNLLAELGKDDGNVEARAQELVDSIVAVVENLAPRLGIIAQNIFAAIPTLIDKLSPYIQQLMDMVGAFLEEHKPEIEAAANVFFDGLVDALTTIIAKLIEHLPDIITKIGEKVPDMRGQIQASAFQMFMGLVEGFANSLTPFFANLEQGMNDALSKIGGFFLGFFRAGGEIAGNIASGVSGALDQIRNVFDKVLYAITHPLETAEGIVRGIADTIANIFSGLHIELPHIAMPHFNVYGGEFPWGVGGQGAPPDFSVDWYGSGGFASTPTLNGYGERGLEMYWPGYAPYFDKYAKGIAEHMPQGAGGVDIHDCTFNVRQESDIRRVAEELNTLINRQTAGAI